MSGFRPDGVLATDPPAASGPCTWHPEYPFDCCMACDAEYEEWQERQHDIEREEPDFE